MLKLHSFLLGIKTEIKKVTKDSYKLSMLVAVYTFVAILLVLNSDNLYHKGNTIVEAYSKVEVATDTFTKVEETDNKAQIRISHSGQESQSQETITYENIEIYGESTVGGMTLLSISGLANVDDYAEEAAIEDTTITEQITIAEEEARAKAAAEAERAKAQKAAEEKAKEEAKAKKAEKAKKAKEKKEAEEKAEKAAKAAKEKEAKEKAARQVQLTSSDKEILQRIVEAEASGEDLKGKMLVANVILNRVKSNKFPNTVKGVVFQKDNNAVQFSPTKDGRYWSVRVSKETITAVDRVLSGEDSSQGALYFSARSKADRSSMRWFDRNLRRLFAHGGHEFFTSK